MKALLQIFLWTCTAVLLGLVIILVMSAIKGHFNSETVTKIVALLNGIDIQGERLRQAVEQGKLVSAEAEAAIVPPVQSPAPLDTLQTDLRSASLDRYKKELDDRAAALKVASDRHNQLVAEFKKATDTAGKEREDASLLQVTEILEALDPTLAKEQIVAMMAKGKRDDVLAIIKVIDADKLKKILGEFVDIADQERISELLDEIRTKGKLSLEEPAVP